MWNCTYYSLNREWMCEYYCILIHYPIYLCKHLLVFICKPVHCLAPHNRHIFTKVDSIRATSSLHMLNRAWCIIMVPGPCWPTGQSMLVSWPFCWPNFTTFSYCNHAHPCKSVSFTCHLINAYIPQFTVSFGKSIRYHLMTVDMKMWCGHGKSHLHCEIMR